MTTAYFLRHGLTQENKERRVQGQTPGTLQIADTERYVAAVVPLLREKHPNVILSSDLERAVKTRRILKKFLLIEDASEGTLPLLRERAMGYYEGMLWEQVPREFQEEVNRDEYDFRKFGGENNEDVRERVLATLRILARQYNGRRVVCVTHSGWLKELVNIAGQAGVLQDEWSNRQSIYEAGIGSVGTIQYFHPIHIQAEAKNPV